MKPNKARFFTVFLALLLFIPAAVKAQITVDLKLDRTVFIAHESITGKLIITNRAGRDLVLGNVNGSRWLDYSVTDSRGHLVSPIRQPSLPPPVVIPSGQTHAMKVTINQAYPMDQVGSYRVKAMVSFPQINRVFPTRSFTIQIAQAKPFWSQVVGVPPGYPGAGTYRVYELLTYFHGSRQKALYFKVKDNSSGRVKACYTLGDYLSVRPPEYKIDRHNQLHVVHMIAPKLYSYSMLDLDGEMITRERYYEKDGSRPRLYSNSSGEVVLKGGITEDQAKTPYENREFRLMSERPPGLPRG